MRSVVTVTLFLVFSLGWCQAPQLLEWPDESILRFSRERWIERYTAEHGESTASMVRAEALYGQALFARNNRLLTSKPEALHEQIGALRIGMTESASELIELSSEATEGGTMWAPIRAAVLADVEAVLHRVIAPEARRQSRIEQAAPVVSVSEVRGALGALEARVTKGAEPRIKAVRDRFEGLEESVHSVLAPPARTEIYRFWLSKLEAALEWYVD